MTAMKAFRFTRPERLARRLDFQRVFKQGRRITDDLLAVHFRPNGLAYSRLGVALGREVHTAVRRNRFKRLVRESFRLNKQSLPAGLDIIVRLKYKPNAANKKNPFAEKLDDKVKALTLLTVQKSLLGLLNSNSTKL